MNNAVHLFAYGTLMCTDIMHHVSGMPATGVPATLCGYARRKVRGETYPALVPDETSTVAGVLYTNLADAAWHRLDSFEGPMYRRETVTVQTEDGSIIPAETYVIHPDSRHFIEPAAWDFQDFLRHGKQRFQGGYIGYQQLERQPEAG